MDMVAGSPYPIGRSSIIDHPAHEQCGGFAGRGASRIWFGLDRTILEWNINEHGGSGRTPWNGTITNMKRPRKVRGRVECWSTLTSHHLSIEVSTADRGPIRPILRCIGHWADGARKPEVDVRGELDAHLGTPGESRDLPTPPACSIMFD